MQIKKSVIEVMKETVTGLCYETGGIIGAHNETITEIVMDLPKKEISRACSYEPDVNFLNGEIEKWSNKGITFKGIFHTHFANVKTLSSADKDYICNIMNAMPPYISKLYFPIFTLPDCKLTGYSANRFADKMIISGELIEIVE